MSQRLQGHARCHVLLFNWAKSVHHQKVSALRPHECYLVAAAAAALLHHPVSAALSLQANTHMEVEMLEQQLTAAKKESVALRRQLAAANAALSAANINPANPALLRVMQAEGAKGGSHRGAGGTPHALALAWARAEAERMSPATVQVRFLTSLNS